MDWIMACAFGHRIDRTFEAVQALGYEGTVSDLQKALRTNGTLLRDLKVYTYAVWRMRRQDTFSFVKARNITVTARYEDPEVFRYAERLASGPRLNQVLLKYEGHNNDILTLEQHSEVIAGVLNGGELRTYVGKFIFKKMKFILHTGVSVDDLRADMLETAVYNLLRTYPNWSGEGHALAIAQSAVKRRGHNIIKEFSAASRNHLLRGEDGTYSAVNVSMDPDVATEFFDSATEYSKVDGSTPESRVQDLVQSIQSVRHRAQYRWQQSYLDLCLDQGRDLFDTWCAQACIRVETDDNTSARFRNAAALYLGVSIDQVVAFIEELRISARLFN